MAKNRQILVKELPEGPLEERHFELREAPLPTPGSGEVLTRTIYLDGRLHGRGGGRFA